MKKLRTTVTALLLTTVLLLNGCAEQSNTPAPGADTSSEISESSFSSSEGLDNSDNITSTTSESSTSSEDSSSTDSGNHPESSTGISSDTTNPDAVPVEFTDEDREIQKILEDLELGCSALDLWFSNSSPVGTSESERLVFKFLTAIDGRYYELPNNHSEGGFVIPNTYEGIKEVVFKYCSGDLAETYMLHLAKGSMTENSDGTFSVSLDEEHKEKQYIRLIEIDGTIYRNAIDETKGFYRAVDPNTAKIIRKTDDTIEFTYLTGNKLVEWYNQIYVKDVSLYEENMKIGVLKYERGGWRRDS